ncbi:hypothetical protein ACFLYW_02380 [Thermodesulfobacteriota bacterium]
MRQYVIDQLSREERDNIESYFKRALKPGPMEGVFWIEVSRDLLSGDQLEHEDCGPFFFAVELAEESVCFELLVRSQSNLHCSCIAYATAAQRDFVLRFADQMLAEEQIKA